MMMMSIKCLSDIFRFIEKTLSLEQNMKLLLLSLIQSSDYIHVSSICGCRGKICFATTITDKFIRLD